MIFQYLGRKTDSLGTAIKWLVYQAGAYDVFIDVFGGTGAASVAMPRRNNAAYIYNDIDKGMSNLWDVIADNELYKELIKDLKDLQLDLEREYTWEFEEEIDFSSEIIKYNGGKDIDPLEPINRKSEPYFSDIVNWMKSLCLAIDDAGIEDTEFIDKVYGVEEPSDQELYYNYIKYYNYINEHIIALQGDYNNSFKIPDIHMEYDSRYDIDIPKGYNKDDHIKVKPVKRKLKETDKDKDPIGYIDYIDYTGQLNLSRFFEWYAYFSNYIKYDYDPDGHDKSIKAVAEIFVDFVTFRGIRSGDAIPSIYVSYEEKWEYYYACDTDPKFPREYNVWKKFTETDFDTIITRLHSLIKKNKSKTGTERTVVENKDFRDIIPQYSCLSMNKKMKQNHPLFYLDSPYLNTTGYRTNFGASDMDDLIKALKASRDKFIFSCRACKSSNAGKAGTNNALRKANQSILSGVFDVFDREFGNNNLYVLTIEPLTNATRKQNIKDSFFKNLVKKNKIAEVMITNYEIHSFDDPDAKFIVYGFAEFMRLLNKYINM
jgi:hypothetical protein